MVRIADAVLAWFIRRLTSVVRLATRLVGLIPAPTTRDNAD